MGVLASRSAAAVAFGAALSLALLAGCESDDEPEGEPGDHLIVSIGDSVASGEGNPDRPATLLRRADWKGGASAQRCHRSRLSANALAALEVLGPEQADRFVSLGCSGATIEKGLRMPYQGIEPSPDDVVEEAQLVRLEELARDHEIDAILVSIGANDVGFSKIVQFCAFNLGGPCQDRPYARDPNNPGKRLTLAEHIPNAIAGLAMGYRELFDDLPEELRARVIITEYFDPTSAPAGYRKGADCEMLLGGIKPLESRWAREKVVRELNQQIQSSADDLGWELVGGVDERFEGHGLCAGRERWVVTARESVFGIGIPLGGSLFNRQTRRRLLASYKGTLHPNPAGHKAIAELIVPELSPFVSEAEGTETVGAED